MPKHPNNPNSVPLDRFRNVYVELDDLDWDEINEFDSKRGDKEYKQYAEREKESDSNRDSKHTDI